MDGFLFVNRRLKEVKLDVTVMTQVFAPTRHDPIEFIFFSLPFLLSPYYLNSSSFFAHQFMIYISFSLYIYKAFLFSL